MESVRPGELKSLDGDAIKHPEREEGIGDEEVDFNSSCTSSIRVERGLESLSIGASFPWSPWLVVWTVEYKCFQHSAKE